MKWDDRSTLFPDGLRLKAPVRSQHHDVCVAHACRETTGMTTENYTRSPDKIRFFPGLNFVTIPRNILNKKSMFGAVSGGTPLRPLFLLLFLVCFSFSFLFLFLFLFLCLFSVSFSFSFSLYCWPFAFAVRAFIKVTDTDLLLEK